MLSYRDAVRLLGGEEGGIVDALDVASAGLLLGGAVANPVALLGWFDARAEFARLSRRLVGTVRQHRAGSRRLGRTQQLAAAHTVLVVAAYFEALAAADLPLKPGEVDLTRAEQLAVAAGGPADPHRSLADSALATAVALPVPHEGHDAYRAQLRDFYLRLGTATHRFLSGLAAWERLPGDQRDRFGARLTGVADEALRRYDDLLLELVRDFPEVAYWAGLREHRATHTALRHLAEALAEIASRTEPPEVRTALHRGYAAALGRPITASAEVPGGMTVPPLADLYLPPPFRVTGSPAGALASDEGVWAEVAVRDDLDDYLTGYLTSPGALRAPMLLLGQPGAGKSVLTKVLAAQLPATDFLPIRVVLRDVESTKDVQGQIEEALRDATGEELRWRDVARTADGALPVILLDGFDELLQATGVSQSNYLVDVARFQEREREQGRAVAVIVTTRTSVADRARTPAGTVVLRLEPFDEPRTRRWLDIWNAANATHFRAAGLRPLPAGTVLGYPGLAGQPLLLLLLALYDAAGNALQRQSGRASLSLCDLYEQLLRSFALREAERHQPRLSPSQAEAWVGAELRKLSIVAFAMFNRSGQWVTHTDLQADLDAIFPPAAGPGSFDALQESALLVGRFFFVHRTQATRRGSTLHTYEFLHATFGEFLVARLTWELLREAGARNAAGSLQFGAADDAGLYRFLSFAALAVRTPTVTFLTGMAAGLTDAAERDRLRHLLTRLYTAAPYEWRPDAPGPQQAKPYQPVRMPTTARIAAYTANLVLLAVVVSERLPYSDLHHPRDREAAEAWHSQALLWHSQLREEEWDSLVALVAVERYWLEEGGERDVRLSLDFDSTPAPVPDPHWTFKRPAAQRGRYAFTNGASAWWVERRANFVCGSQDDLIHRALRPLLDSDLEVTARTFVSWFPESYPSAAEALLTVLLSPALPDQDPEERRAAYLRCARIAAGNFPPWSTDAQVAYTGRLLAAIAADRAAGAGLAAQVLKESRAIPNIDAAQCALAVLARTPPTDDGIAELMVAIGNLLELSGLGRPEAYGTTSAADLAGARSAYLYQLLREVGNPKPHLLNMVTFAPDDQLRE